MASQVNGYIGQINPGDGTNYAIGSTAYGYCETAAATVEKVLDMTGFTLIPGATISVKFKNANTSAAAPTLNVNSTGAKPIIAPHKDIAYWNANDVVSLTYDGTSWILHTSEWKASLISEDVDINDLKEPGRYIISNSILPTYAYINHMPLQTPNTISWEIEVKEVNAGRTRVTQTAHAMFYQFETYVEPRFMRFFNASGWTPWVRENPYVAELIPANSANRFDLNNLLIPGRYASGGGQANFFDHKPVSTSGKGWEIMVRELLAKNSTYLLQEARDGQNKRYYRLTADGGETWTSWTQEYNSLASLTGTVDKEGAILTFTDNNGTENDGIIIPFNNGAVRFYSAATTTSAPYIYAHFTDSELFASGTKMIHGSISLYPYDQISNFGTVYFNCYFSSSNSSKINHCYTFDPYNLISDLVAVLDETTHTLTLKFSHVARYTCYEVSAYTGSNFDNLIAQVDAVAPDSSHTLSEYAFTTKQTLIDKIETATTSTTTSLAPLASPSFTGTPLAPTAAVGTNTTQIATTAFVRAALPAPVKNISANTTISASTHFNSFLLCTGTITLTIPTGLTVGMEFEVMNYGTGIITVKGASGVTLNGTAAGSKTIEEQYASAILKCVASNTWVIQGAIS